MNFKQAAAARMRRANILGAWACDSGLPRSHCPYRGKYYRMAYHQGWDEAAGKYAEKVTVQIITPSQVRLMRYEESRRKVPDNCPGGLEFWRQFHRQFYLDDPYLDVSFLDPAGLCIGLFRHDPLIGMPSGFPDNEDFFYLRQDDRLGVRRICPSSNLLKALRRVLYEP